MTEIGLHGGPFGGGKYRKNSIVTESRDLALLSSKYSNSYQSEYGGTGGNRNTIMACYGGYFWQFMKDFYDTYWRVKKYDFTAPNQSNPITTIQATTTPTANGWAGVYLFVQDKGYMFISCDVTSKIQKFDFNTQTFSVFDAVQSVKDITYNETLDKLIVTTAGNVRIVNPETLATITTYGSGNITLTSGAGFSSFRSAALSDDNIIHVSIVDSVNANYIVMYGLNNAGGAKVYESRLNYNQWSTGHGTVRYAPTLDAVMLCLSYYNGTEWSDVLMKVNRSTGAIIKNYYTGTRDYRNIAHDKIFCNKYGIVFNGYSSLIWYTPGDRKATDTINTALLTYPSDGTYTYGPPQGDCKATIICSQYDKKDFIVCWGSTPDNWNTGYAGRARLDSAYKIL